MRPLPRNFFGVGGMLGKSTDFPPEFARHAPAPRLSERPAGQRRLPRIFALLSAAALLVPCLASLAACGGNDIILLRVYNWEEYIDEGGEGSYEYDYEVNEDGSAPSLVDDFEVWYEETYGTPVTV